MTVLAPRALGRLLVACGLLGLAGAFVLAVERFKLLDNPLYVPGCDVGAVLSCLDVMHSDQATLFGFPNPLLGLVGFPVVAATGAAVLAGARLASWFWAGLAIGLSAAVLFVHWLIFQTLYRIGALCPYCMVVWAATVPAWWYVALQVAGPRFPTLQRNHLIAPTLWLLIIAALVYERFWAPWR